MGNNIYIISDLFVVNMRGGGDFNIRWRSHHGDYRVDCLITIYLCWQCLSSLQVFRQPCNAESAETLINRFAVDLWR